MDTITDLVTTRTVIASVGLEFNIQEIFEKVPINKTLDAYSCKIITCYYQNRYRGENIFSKKKKNQSFRNAVNVIFQIENKTLNFKVSTNGNFQITGCKYYHHVIECTKYFLQLLKQYCPETVSIWNKNISIGLRTVMTNIVFNMGFCIDRKKLNSVLQKEKDFYNLFETNFGYTGMNIKLPLENEDYIVSLPKINWNENTWENDNETKNLMTDKQKYNTFLVFHSGKIIMSGMCEKNMYKHFEYFHKFLEQNKSKIEETIKK